MQGECLGILLILSHPSNIIRNEGSNIVKNFGDLGHTLNMVCSMTNVSSKDVKHLWNISHILSKYERRTVCDFSFFDSILFFVD